MNNPSPAGLHVAGAPLLSNILTAVLLSLLILFATMSTVGATPGARDEGLDLSGGDVNVFAVEFPAPEPTVEPHATARLNLPAGRALIRTARAFLWPGLVTIALLVGFGLAGRMTRARQGAPPKLDDDLRSFR